ncbi:MAG: NAD-dependent epimerase/dehydratase family protein [Myxococcota bacterium]|nr:NAD-dependent epimerase/dehydratase family protein [Myxococcota bacterium]
MRVLLTGATGFLGRNILSRLHDSGHTLVAMTRNPDADLGADIERVVGDVLDAASLKAAMAGVDVLIHGAGKVSHKPADAAELMRLHVNGTENVLDAAAEAGVSRVVYISTSGTIAVSDDLKSVPNEESSPPLPFIKEWPYYRSKLFAEQKALARSTASLPIISLNPSLLLGPGDVPDGPSTASVRHFLDGDIPASPPGGLSFVDVRDVAEAVALAITKGEPGQRYLLGSANMTFSSFYGRLARISGKSAPLATMPAATLRLLRFLPKWKKLGTTFGIDLTREELELACHVWYLDNSRAAADLGWTPRDPQRTLEDTVHDIQSRAGEYEPWV